LRLLNYKKSGLKLRKFPSRLLPFPFLPPKKKKLPRRERLKPLRKVKLQLKDKEKEKLSLKVVSLLLKLSPPKKYPLPLSL
jgi:hypothetical protein